MPQLPCLPLCTCPKHNSGNWLNIFRKQMLPEPWDEESFHHRETKYYHLQIPFHPRRHIPRIGTIFHIRVIAHLEFQRAALHQVSVSDV